MLKMEEVGGEELSASSLLQVSSRDGDGGKELLRHLLKDKSSPATTPSPTTQAPPIPRCQLTLSNESVRSEEEDRPGSHGNMVRSGLKNKSLNTRSSVRRTRVIYTERYQR